MNAEPKRFSIAFHMNVGGHVWSGGVQYLHSLFAALKELAADRQPELVLLLGAPAERVPEILAPLVDRVLSIPPESSEPVAGRLSWLVNLPIRSVLAIRRRLTGRREEPAWEQSLSVYLRQQGVDVLFSNIDFNSGFHVPLLVWIPDFQVRRLAGMFPPEETEALDRYRQDMARWSDRIIVSSEDVRKDFASFAPEWRDKARLLRFVVPVPEAVYAGDSAWICAHYGLPERFFYLPNQFWKHKNHDAVMQALCRLNASHRDVVVVCTGNTRDHRHPAYFGELLARLSREGLRDRMILLGLVPRDHLWMLMRQSVAVLQPSLFEGWSTTVEEAKSLGKAILLSDIPVHREQNPPSAVYFDPGDPVALSECMARVWAERQAGPDPAMEAAARLALPARMREFAEQFMRVVDEARRGDGTPKRSAPNEDMIQ